MIPLFFTKAVLQSRWLARRRPTSALGGLLSSEQFARVLQRERARSDRTGEVFSLVVFAVGRQKADYDTLAHLAEILQRRLRLTDDAGLLDQRKIGVVLPATPASGAWTVADDVCVCVPAGLPLPECTRLLLSVRLARRRRCRRKQGRRTKRRPAGRRGRWSRFSCGGCRFGSG